jgi:hypothetical protein
MAGGIENELFRVLMVRVGIQKEIQSYIQTPWKLTAGFGIKAGKVSLDGSYEYNTVFHVPGLSISDQFRALYEKYPVANVSFKVAL